MDFPPLIALLSQAVRGVAGSSLFALRLVPALAGTAVMLLAILIARELGGGRRAQLLTALAVLINPLFLRTANLFQPVVLDQLWWLLGCYALARLANTGDVKWWLVLGAAGGVGLLTKFSIGFFGLAVLVALLLTPYRRVFLGPWPWIAAGLALVLGSPSVIGQLALGFPVLDQMAALREGQLARVGFGEFVFDQFLMQPAGFFLAVAGALALLLHPALRPYRHLGWIAVAAFTTFVLMQGKSYYFGPMHPVLFAAGAVAIERVTRPRARTALTWSAGALIVLWAGGAVPFGLPIVPPEPMARYSAAIGITTAVRTNWGEYLPLPQDYADMLGWREQTEAVARAYRALTPAEQAQTVLYARNYGEAGALDFYGRELGLPPVISLAGSFYFFGPGERAPDVWIVLGVEPEEITTIDCQSLELADRVANPWGVPEERDVPIVVCRHPSLTPQEFWERVGRPGWG
jgi:4-amino-4-deoxy-L-arabinose transferase-like glycosyltransferase